MSAASMAAWDRIIPELPKREQAVLQTLMKPRGDHYRGRTNREIAQELGLPRDSISPRTARLRQKGLVVEIGTRGPETIYEHVAEPNFVKAPGPRKPKAYYEALRDAHSFLCARIGCAPIEHMKGLEDALKAIERMIP